MENPSPKRKKQRQILSAYTPDRLSAIVAKLLEIGIVSFSQELSNTLMWSHYAKNHSGACLTYENPASFVLDNTPAIVGWDAVRYDNDGIEKFFRKLKPTTCASDFCNFIQPLLISALTTKSKPWKYEREFRIVKSQHGPFSIDRKWLRQVCFGLATSEAHIKLICSIVSKHGYQVVAFYRMTRSKERDFEYVPTPLA